MYLVPAKVVPKKTEQATIGFKGLNRMPVTDSGELTAMTNISGMYAPALYPRPSREVVETLTSCTSLFAANGKLCWVDGTHFYYDGDSVGTVTAGAKSIAEYFGIILIFPDAKYYNYDDDEFGDIDSAEDLGIEYVCVHNNRAYGCGGNGFYASKISDPLSWDDLPVPITVGCSWQTNTGEEGDFTGIIATQDYVVATKENWIYELYNDRPSNFLLKAVQNSGCIDYRSLVDVNGILFMLGNEGIKVYTGGATRVISYDLNETYVSGAAGTDGRQYYISLYNGASYNLYVYDTKDGLWRREDDLQATCFLRQSDTLSVLAENEIIQFNSGSEIPEWSAEMEFTENYLGKKIHSIIRLAAELETGSTLSIYYALDGGTYALAGTYDYFIGYRSVEVNIVPEQCDKFKIKLSGTGYVKIFELSRLMTFGSTIMANRGDVFRWDAFDLLKWETADTLLWYRVNKYEL